MPVQTDYPGVYIQELPSGVRTIVGVSTSVTAFIGRARRGPVNEPVRIFNSGDFERRFGGLWEKSTLSYAVSQYFMNGGSQAVIVRLENGAEKATFSLPPESGTNALQLEAGSAGEWGNHLRVWVDHDTRDSGDDKLFNLFVEEVDPDDPDTALNSESFLNVSVDPDAPRHVGQVLESQSALLRMPDPYPGAPGSLPGVRPAAIDAANANKPGTKGDDGKELKDAQYQGSRNQKTGIYALEKTDIFNLLCIPPRTRLQDIDFSVWSEALQYCKEQRAMLIVDPPRTWGRAGDALNVASGLRDENSALFFPRVRLADPLKENRLETFAPCGVVAGVFARTDAQRGVWKAPAGIEAGLVGVRELALKLTDGENGLLNPKGINALRTFPVIGPVVWGARTLEGADRLASQWKYIPVRRTALFIEESLYRGTQWAVFEPNDPSLWAQLRLNIGTFMQRLFRQGAFQGTSPREAYLVKCDSETTTQADIDRGIVNIVVGFAPLKPAEFVIIKIKQLTGQS